MIASAIGKSSASAGVVIFGNLGVGKSRLAQEAASRCDGAIVHWATGSSAARAIPLGAFVNWLPVDIVEPVQATGRVVNELIKGAGPRPCVVVVDDAHLLDDTSAFMLQQLVDRRLARLVLTVCSGAAVSDAVSALWRDRAVSRLDLQPLGHADCLTLLESVLNGSVDPVSERRLWSLTRGNVGFLRRIVEQEMCAGRLRRTDGTWTWLPGAVVPSSVCELIEHQMGELTGAIADTVDLLSVAEPLTLRMLVDIVGCEPVEHAERARPDHRRRPRRTRCAPGASALWGGSTPAGRPHPAAAAAGDRRVTTGTGRRCQAYPASRHSAARVRHRSDGAGHAARR